MNSKMTTVPTSVCKAETVELKKEGMIELAAESKQSLFGNYTWQGSHGQDCYKLEEMTVTLFRALNDAGGYKSYLTFSTYSTFLGWSTDHHRNYPDEGIFLFCKLLNDQGGVLLQWDIPVIDIQCGDNRVPIFFQMDNVNPDIYPLVSNCSFGQARHNTGDKC